MQMQHVRVSRGPQVPVPPVSTTPLEISRELQQQLRVTRHRAFERLQENAQWAKELLNGVQSTDDTFVTTGGLASSAEELQQKLKDKKQEVDELERQLAQQNEDEQAAQRRFDEILTAMKSAGSVTALKECEEKLEVEKKLLPNKQRKMDIVRL
ncbi:hypothetical protein DVH05_014964 [Phytophthora capsici]|nr:hypothetical protein DVH05_014964 [Phytophthora capsici]|eukprot:jgi/Phyca11/7674/fgenesh1_pm.PHYCAscaffold_21_\